MFENEKKHWLETAESLKPVLRKETVRPIAGMPAEN